MEQNLTFIHPQTRPCEIQEANLKNIRGEKISGQL